MIAFTLLNQTMVKPYIVEASRSWRESKSTVERG